jgi:hypothetical protein
MSVGFQLRFFNILDPLRAQEAMRFEQLQDQIAHFFLNVLR